MRAGRLQRLLEEGHHLRPGITRRAASLNRLNTGDESMRLAVVHRDGVRDACLVEGGVKSAHVLLGDRGIRAAEDPEHRPGESFELLGIRHGLPVEHHRGREIRVREAVTQRGAAAEAEPEHADALAIDVGLRRRPGVDRIQILGLGIVG